MESVCGPLIYRMQSRCNLNHAVWSWQSNNRSVHYNEFCLTYIPDPLAGIMPHQCFVSRSNNQLDIRRSISSSRTVIVVSTVAQVPVINNEVHHNHRPRGYRSAHPRCSDMVAPISLPIYRPCPKANSRPGDVEHGGHLSQQLQLLRQVSTKPSSLQNAYILYLSASKTSKAIQAAECAYNTRTSSQTFAVFVTDHQYDSSHGAPYGTCTAYSCTVPTSAQMTDVDSDCWTFFWDNSGESSGVGTSCIKDPSTGECGCENSDGTFVAGSSSCK